MGEKRPSVSVSHPQMNNPFELVLITPQLAAEWLGMNVEINRSVRNAKVASIARDIKNGAWRITHQAIAFDWEGKLIDGQHRLRAIVKSEIPTKVWVFRGLDPHCFTVIDSGCARTASDALKKHGIKNTTAVAAGVRLVLKHKKQHRTSRLHTKTFANSHTEIERYALDNFETCNEAAAFAASVNRESRLIRCASAVGFLLLCHEKNDPDLFHEAMRFVGRLAVGADLPRGSVELALRKYLESTTPRTHNLNSTDFSLAILIKAFNHHLTGEPMLNFKAGSLSPFPAIGAEV